MLLFGGLPGVAQDIEPRRWSHLPTGVNYAGAGYAFTAADVLLDPVLELRDVTLDLQTFGAKYLRTFEVLDRSARVELTVPYQHGLWISGGAGYGFGGQSSIDGVPKDDRKGFLVVCVSAGVPITRSMGIKVSYFNSVTQESTGFDSNTIAAAISVLW